MSEKRSCPFDDTVKEGIEKPRAITFDIGEKSQSHGRSFASFEGMVEEIDDVRGRVKVSVSIFDVTPVELEFGQVEKV